MWINFCYDTDKSVHFENNAFSSRKMKISVICIVLMMSLSIRAGLLKEKDRDFSEYDADDNGKLAREELQSYIRENLGKLHLGTGTVVMIFNTADTDHDGFIDADEFDAKLRKYGTSSVRVRRV
ncbi:hypothetical protein ACHWQZ_G018650 [Mnemiopsis leidyi]